MEKTVNGIRISDEDIREAERIENDPDKILALIDLIFLFEDNKKSITKKKKSGVHLCSPLLVM